MPLAPPPVPPPSSSKNKGKSQIFQNFVLKHHLKAYSDLIWKWANVYGIDPVYYAALLAFESGGNPNARSNAGAVGLAQIHLPSHPNISDAQARNPAFAIKWGAQFFADKVQKYGSYDAAYRRGYNPGYQGGGPFTAIPKGYVAKGSGLSPSEKGPVSVETTVARKKAEAGNPYLQGYAFQQAWKGTIDPIYEAYAGRGATKAEAMKALKNGWSAYHIQVMLSGQKSFVNSPVWKSNAPSYQAIYRNIYGNVRPPNQLISYAIVHNLGASFADTLRQGKGYVKSQEFKANATSMANVYRKIFGEPDLRGNNVIDRVTAAGWTADQFADYLRKQPDYVKSNEFKARAQGVAQTFGNVTTLTQAQADEVPLAQGAPQDWRLPNYEQPAPTPAQKPAAKPKPKAKKKATPAPKPQPVAGGAGGQQGY